MNSLLFAAAVVLMAALPACQAAQRRDVHMKLQKKEAKMSGLSAQLNVGLMSAFTATEEAATAKGNMRRRIRQTYGGLPVVGASADVEVTRDGVMTGAVTGNLAFDLQSDIPDPEACHRERQELLSRCRRYLRDNRGLPINENTPLENVQIKKKVDFEGDDAPAKLVYEVVFFIDLEPTPCRPFFQLDACDPDLAVIRYFDKIHNMTLALKERQAEEQCDTTARPTAGPTSNPGGACQSDYPAQGVGGNQKTGQITYGQDQPYCLRTEVAGDQCTMTSKYAVVIDLENTRSSSGRTAVEFTCSQGYSDPINGAFGVANDAFYYGHSTGLMYEEWYGLYALGYAPQLRVHYGSCYENAFWNGRDMTFGDGCNYLYPLVNQDVTAHELGHGVTDRFSDLYYDDQSGGMNEAFSDMSGEVAEMFSTGRNDWEVGRELFKGNQALRYFEQPSRDGRSIDTANDYYDDLDVHYSSGVFNRAFFQLVTVQGVPIRRAYEIMLHANRLVWTERSTFVEGACGAMKAAYDLGYDVVKVKNAFDVVDVDTSSCNYESFGQTVSSGETREGVMVASLRNPVFALDAPDGTVVIDVVGSPEPVTVYVTSDAAGSVVVDSGNAPFTFEKTSAIGYFKLSTSQDDDATISVTVNAA